MEKKGVYIHRGERVLSFEKYGKGNSRLAIRTRFMGVQEGAVYLESEELEALREFLSEDDNERKE